MIHSASSLAVRRLNDLSPQSVTTFPEKPKKCVFRKLDPEIQDATMKSICIEEISGMLEEINSVAPFTNLDAVKNLFLHKLHLILYRFAFSLDENTIRGFMPIFLTLYIRFVSVAGAKVVESRDNSVCFVDKLMEVYKKNDSIEDLAVALSNLLKRINENSVSSSLPMLY